MTTKENTWEACPRCGKRSRRSDCLMCKVCNDEFVENNATAILEERPIADKFETVATDGQETLRQKLKELAETESKKQERRNELWRNAELTVARRLRSQEVRVSSKTRRAATVKTFRESKETDEKLEKISRKVHGLRKSIDSLKNFLAGLEQKQEEYARKQQEEESREELHVA